MKVLTRNWFAYALFLFTSGCAGGGEGTESENASERLTINSACPTYIEGPPVGLSLLHAAHPNARDQAILLATLAAQSCRRNIAFTMLVDGTFGTDRQFLEEVVHVATSHGATLHLYLYLSNGPWQRRGNVPDRGFGSKLSPEEFRRRISSDPSYQDAFRGVVKWSEPLMRFAVERGGAVYLIPMLEDNLDEQSARVMESLVSETVDSSIPFTLGRNPCLNCHSGNDGSVTPGIFLDQHLHNIYEPIAVQNGLVSNDGANFHFPGEHGKSEFSLEDMFRYAGASAANNNAFVLWKAEYQGQDGSGGFKDPDTRHYASPSPEQAEMIKQFLGTSF